MCVSTFQVNICNVALRTSECYTLLVGMGLSCWNLILLNLKGSPTVF